MDQHFHPNPSANTPEVRLRVQQCQVNPPLYPVLVFFRMRYGRKAGPQEVFTLERRKAARKQDYPCGPMKRSSKPGQYLEPQDPEGSCELVFVR